MLRTTHSIIGTKPTFNALLLLLGWVAVSKLELGDIGGTEHKNLLLGPLTIMAGLLEIWNTNDMALVQEF